MAIVLLCLVLCSVSSVRADQVLFKNGDRLTGKVEQLVDGMLTLDSDLAGRVTVDMAGVETFSSDVPVDVHFVDGRTVHQQVIVSEPGSVTIPPERKVAIDDIASINPPPKPKPKWAGDISAGYTSTHGNTRTDAASASANLGKRTEKDRTTLSADYARGRQADPATGKMNKTEDWWRSKAKYDHFFTKKVYGYLDGRYETDDIALLDRRVIIGAGLGYQWVESEGMNFSTEAGAAWLHEKYSNQTGSNEEVSLQFGYNFSKRIHENMKFIHDLTYYPSTESFSDYFLTSTVELRANFTERAFTNFKAILNYDDTPAQGKHKTDVKYIWGIGWSF
jgi:putative salt-induced outer membrane protein YdiY